LQTKLKILGASQIIEILEAEFAAGRIVEMLEGLPANRYAMIRPNKKENVLNPLMLGIVSENEWERVIAWHALKWQQLLKDKKFRRWANRHPVPGVDD